MNRRNFLKALPALAAVPMIPLPKSPEGRFYEDTDWVDPGYDPNVIEYWRIIWAWDPAPEFPEGSPNYIFRLQADSVKPQFMLEILCNRKVINVPQIKGTREDIARVTKNNPSLSKLGYEIMCKTMDKWLLDRFNIVI